MGTIECILWNSKFLMWGLFFSSTINIVAVTIERLVTISKQENIFVHCQSHIRGFLKLVMLALLEFSFCLNMKIS